MPELDFSIEGAHVLSSGAQAAIGLCVQIVVTPPETHVYSLSLNYDVRIDAVRRRYTDEEQRHLISLFGPIGNWCRTLHALPWLSGTAQVPAFIGQRLIDVSLPCRGEINPVVARYFDALAAGDVLLVASFSGAGFVASDSLPLQMSRIPWDRQATFRLPLGLWREAREHRCQEESAVHLV
jgi:hypothetical protein